MWFLIPILLVTIICDDVSSHPKHHYDLENAEQLFEDFKKTFNKKYDSAEENAKRFENFKTTVKKINELNSDLPTPSYAINDLSDLSFEEFKMYYTNCHFDNNATVAAPVIPRTSSAPASLDWRQYGLVTAIKNQGQCGSCFAFAAVAAIEGAHAKNTRQLISLSEQQALDCSHGDCARGGLIDDAITGVAQSGGSEREEDYPYRGVKGQCATQPSKVVVKLTGPIVLPTDENQLAELLYQYGPLGVESVSACYSPYLYFIIVSYKAMQTNDIFQHIHGTDIVTECSSGKPTGGHAVTLIGYGKDPGSWSRLTPGPSVRRSVTGTQHQDKDAATGTPYWLLKNSWGTSWGDQGYFRLARGVNACSFPQAVVAAGVQ